MQKREILFAWQLLLLTALLLLPLGLNHNNGKGIKIVRHELSRVRARFGATAIAAPDYAQNEYGRLSSRGTTVLPRGFDRQDYLSDVISEGMYQWPKEKLPVKVYLAPADNVPGYHPQYRSYVVRAFDSWAEASEGRLPWVQVSDRASADITIDWTNQVTERTEGTEAGRTSALTRLNTATNQGTIYGAKMVLLTKLPDRAFADDEVEKTCLHEVGHALGIQGHSPYRDDIMFYAVSPTQKPFLTDRDRNTMNHLYADYPVQNTIGATALNPHKS